MKNIAILLSCLCFFQFAAVQVNAASNSNETSNKDSSSSLSSESSDFSGFSMPVSVERYGNAETSDGNDAKPENAYPSYLLNFTEKDIDDDDDDMGFSDQDDGKKLSVIMHNLSDKQKTVFHSRSPSPVCDISGDKIVLNEISSAKVKAEADLEKFMNDIKSVDLTNDDVYESKKNELTGLYNKLKETALLMEKSLEDRFGIVYEGESKAKREEMLKQKEDVLIEKISEGLKILEDIRNMQKHIESVSENS